MAKGALREGRRRFSAAYVPSVLLFGFKMDVPLRRKRRNGVLVNELLFSLHFQKYGEVVKPFNVSAQLEAVQ